MNETRTRNRKKMENGMSTLRCSQGKRTLQRRAIQNGLSTAMGGVNSGLPKLSYMAGSHRTIGLLLANGVFARGE
jgi:hypothetical protein